MVAVVGATFAYFTATTTSNTTESKVNVNTAEVGGTEFNFTSTTGKDIIDYPGGIAIVAAKAEGKKADGNNTGNNYDFDFKLNITSETTITTVLNWSLYRKDGTTPASLTGADQCKLVSEPQAEGKTNYYYSVGAKKTSESGQDCTVTSLELTSELGSKVANGTISAGEVTGAEAINQHIDSEVSDGTAYYYLVIEYENESSDQTTGDTGEKNTISVTLTADKGVQVTPVKVE